MRTPRREGDDEPVRCSCHGVPVAWRDDDRGLPVAVCAIDEEGLDVLREAAAAGVDVVGPDNLTHVDLGMRGAAKVVVGWGANAATCPPTPVATLLANWSRPLWCVDVTKDGHPRHPSRGGYRELVRWTRGAS